MIQAFCRWFNQLWFSLDLPEWGMPKARRGYLEDRLRQLDQEAARVKREMEETLRAVGRLDGLQVRP